MRFLTANSDALLIELDDLNQTLALFSALQALHLPGVTHVVPAARTLLVHFEPARLPTQTLVDTLSALSLDQGQRALGDLIEIPVHYSGEDLAEVAALTGLSPQEVVRRHTSCTWDVAFTGFAPGFAYLTGGDPLLQVPRRTTPRTRIPAGSVALAGPFSGIYPQASPGGWQIIGTTPLAMWDINRNPPALLQPGQRVRFVDLSATTQPQPLTQTEASAARSTEPVPSQRTAPQATTALEVLATGLQTLFQDLGRHGLTGQGVSASGALDASAMRNANRLVGNPVGSAVLECVAGGLQLRSRGDTVLAVTGAHAALTLISASGPCWRVPMGHAVALNDGDTLQLGAPDAGVRSYVAVRGGFDIPPVLGSFSTDTLAKVGPEPLAVGDVLGVWPAPPSAITGSAGTPPAHLPRADHEVVLDVIPGPRTDWFSDDALDVLANQRWRVTPLSNRVGLRLEGSEPLSRAITGELPSEGTVPGALQIPPSGQPVLFLADHPLTGGYPVIAAIAPHHLGLAGQAPVGAWLRFRPIQPFAELTPSAPTHSEP